MLSKRARTAFLRMAKRLLFARVHGRCGATSPKHSTPATLNKYIPGVCSYDPAVMQCQLVQAWELNARQRIPAAQSSSQQTWQDACATVKLALAEHQVLSYTESERFASYSMNVVILQRSTQNKTLMSHYSQHSMCLSCGYAFSQLPGLPRA